MVSTAGAWLHALDLRRARTVVAVEGGAGVRSAAFPLAHDHNKVSLLADSVSAPGAAERVLAGLSHRLVEVRTPGCERADRALLAAGYARDDAVVMEHAGPAGVPGGATVLTVAQRVGAAEAGWRDEQPDAGPDTWRQLGARIATVRPAARAVFLGVVDDDGRVLARTDLYLHEGVAQVEEVVTDPAHRGRGHATLLVRDAVARARAQLAMTVFLLADADDWPRRLYARLGFAESQVLPSYRALSSVSCAEGMSAPPTPPLAARGLRT